MLMQEPESQSFSKLKRKKETNHTCKKHKAKQGNLCNSDNDNNNSINVVTPKLLPLEKKYLHPAYSSCFNN
jgi:hypothetical protein